MPEPFEWDEDKSKACRETRGFDFSVVEGFDFGEALIVEDTRRDYGERRFRAFGHIGNDAFSVVFTPRGDRIRIISVRRAHARELKRYGIAKKG